MKILICGVGAIGSNLVRYLVPDLRGEHEITILDMDNVEERNITPGTQWYTPNQIGLPKVEALQFNVYQTFERDIEINNMNVEDIHTSDLRQFNLVIDCFDNYEARNLLQQEWVINFKTISENWDLIHLGFSDQFTFEIEWSENYQIPTNITTGMDICEMPGAAGFVGSVASLGALVVENYINKNDKMRVLGGKYHRTFIS